MSWLVLPIYQFVDYNVVSRISDILLENEVGNHIKPNYIITLTEIQKSKEGRGSKEAWKSGCLPGVKKSW